MPNTRDGVGVIPIRVELGKSQGEVRVGFRVSNDWDGFEIVFTNQVLD
jgi:hypothetical protein